MPGTGMAINLVVSLPGTKKQWLWPPKAAVLNPFRTPGARPRAPSAEPEKSC